MLSILRDVQRGMVDDLHLANSPIRLQVPVDNRQLLCQIDAPSVLCIRAVSIKE